MLAEITPLILTFDEAPNIERTLKALSWAKDILVVDSFSTDATLDIVRRFPAARVIQRRFDTFARQCNFGLQHVTTPWVLSLDADYVVSRELVDEIARLPGGASERGYRVRFRYCVAGRPLRASLYPPRAVLYRRDKACYADEGHGHRVRIDGPVGDLDGVIDHDDRKPFSRWLSEQHKYMRAESRHLLDAPSRDLTLQDRLRRWVVFAPPAVLVHTLILKGLILDGWAGWTYTAQRTIAEVLLSARIAEIRLRGRQ